MKCVCGWAGCVRGGGLQGVCAGSRPPRDAPPPPPPPHTHTLQAMNRSLTNVILGGYASAAKGPAAAVTGTHTEIDVPGAAEALMNGGVGCVWGWLGGWVGWVALACVGVGVEGVCGAAEALMNGGVGCAWAGGWAC